MISGIGGVLVGGACAFLAGSVIQTVTGQKVGMSGIVVGTAGAALGLYVTRYFLNG